VLVCLGQLMKTYEWIWLERARFALAGFVGFQVVWVLLLASRGVDVFTDVAQVVVGAVCFAYLSLSTRVKRVFLTHDWEPSLTQASKGPLGI